MKSFALFILSALSLFSVGSAFKGCESTQMNELCQDKIVDRCYTCIRVNKDIRYPHPPVCVPVFQHNLGVLDNYPVDKWNCTMYRPTPVNPQVENDYDNDDEEDVEMMEKIADYLSDKDSDKISTEIIKEDETLDELTSEERFIKDVCAIDDFIFEMCHEQDNNGFCMIASFIHDLCNADGSSNDNSREVSLESVKHIENVNYVSPWGLQSECNQYFYKEICTNKLAKFCFDCRKFIGKELFTQKPRYSYYCSPFYKDMNEKESLDWFAKEKYECKRWYNPNFKPSFSTENFETEGKLYPACTGPICRKEGWFYRGDHFGKEWCGMGKCKEYFGNRVLCDFPTNCGKKNNALSVKSETFQREFKTLGCGSEKFKCMLKKSCRNLVKQLDNCDKDLACVYGVISGTDNESFLKLVKCMFPN